MSWQSIYPADVVFWTGRTAKLQVWFSTQRSLFHWYLHLLAGNTDCLLEVCKEKTTSRLPDKRNVNVEKRGTCELTGVEIIIKYFQLFWPPTKSALSARKSEDDSLLTKDIIINKRGIRIENMNTDLHMTNLKKCGPKIFRSRWAKRDIAPLSFTYIPKIKRWTPNNHRV